MVPPDRIELSASSLPMTRSTPELRRHNVMQSGMKAGGTCHREMGKASVLDAIFFTPHGGGRDALYKESQAMIDDKPKTEKNAASSDAQSARQERLNAALRANLQKRKAQSRTRAKAAPDPESGPEKDTEAE